jgi:hypothetical protein
MAEVERRYLPGKWVILTLVLITGRLELSKILRTEVMKDSTEMTLLPEFLLFMAGYPFPYSSSGQHSTSLSKTAVRSRFLQHGSSQSSARL